MKESIVFIIDSDPVAWKRPGQNGRFRYDTQRSTKNDLGRIIRLQAGNRIPLEGKIQLEAIFAFSTPCSTSKKKAKLLIGQKHDKKPDIDNCLKFYLDLCKDCGVYHDDCQVCDVSMVKLWSDKSEVILHFVEL